MKQKGKLIILSGFAGSGKGTIVQSLLKDHGDEYALSVSATTRSPRPGEKDGEHYFFLTKEQFEDMIQKDAFLEYAQYVNNYYGTPRHYVEEQLNSGKNVILEIEIQGALQVKKRFEDALLLFVTPPSAKILEDRLRGRGTETEEVILSRMKRAHEEAEGCEVYDYLIINDDLDACIDRVHQIIQCENCKMKNNLAVIDQIKKDLTIFAKGE
ncbi:MAG TPA: guanylate kinase [Candidatus Eubacterium avistercoris]|uniref:Guanylate kinase n=1 Tax=Candidatus Eubacterium avistercoris TaxID=2838567 RepID=A0A9D2IH49_9FIRM|nr:guanylate kinase [Candidatus Eubacterium avistercoris]